MSDDDTNGPVNLEDDDEDGLEADAIEPGEPHEELGPSDGPDQGHSAAEGPDPATVDPEPPVIDIDEKE